jgi:hypothetical protein
MRRCVSGLSYQHEIIDGVELKTSAGVIARAGANPALSARP